MKFSNLENQNKILIISFVIFLGLYVLLAQRQKTTEAAKPLAEKIETADTFIPVGHVLVPIEIENVDSVSGIIGSFALVDLYVRPQQTGVDEMFLVAQKIKLIRAPLNPNQYAVLASEAESAELLKMNPRFYVTIHNQKNSLGQNSGTANKEKIAKIPRFEKNPETTTALAQSNLVRSNLTHSSLAKPEDTKPKRRNLKRSLTKSNNEIQIEYYETKKSRYL